MKIKFSLPIFPLKKINQKTYTLFGLTISKQPFFVFASLAIQMLFSLCCKDYRSLSLASTCKQGWPHPDL